MSRARLARTLGMAVSLAAAALSAGRAGADASWLPLQPENRWSYTSTGTRTIRLPHAAETVTPTSGKHTTEVTRQIGGAAGGDGAFEMVHGSEKPNDAGGVERESEKWFVSRMGDRLMLVGGDSDAAPIQIRRPVTLFPAEPRPGLKYDAGRLVSKGIDLDMQGEVVGFEDVKTPAGSFRRCLVLRLTGKVAGAAEAGAGLRVALEGGTAETREWYCKGVGLVKDRMQMTVQMRLPDGNLASTEESFERVLQDYSVAGSPARQER
jgi:hypothetical protein